jgi:hypothetical protein
VRGREEGRETGKEGNSRGRTNGWFDGWESGGREAGNTCNDATAEERDSNHGAVHNPNNTDDRGPAAAAETAVEAAQHTAHKVADHRSAERDDVGHNGNRCSDHLHTSVGTERE